MSQVPAITNETAISPDMNGTSSSAQDVENFDRILEEEKRKIVFPLAVPLLQSISLSPESSNTDLDDAVGKMESKSGTNNDIKKDVVQVNQTTNKEKEKVEKNDAKTSPVDAAKADRSQEVRFASNVANRIFAGQIELDQELYGNIKTAGDGISALKGVDLTDLISQIQDKIKLLKDRGKIELTIQLKPDELGSILMSVTSDKGVLSIAIYADKMAKQSLDENIGELESSLKRSHLNIGSLNVFSEGQRKNNRGDNLSELLYNNGQES